MGWDNGNFKSQWTSVGNAGQPSDRGIASFPGPFKNQTKEKGLVSTVCTCADIPEISDNIVLFLCAVILVHVYCAVYLFVHC